MTEVLRTIDDIDECARELEFLTDNLLAVHTAMESDGGANWQHMCNAVFSAWLHLRHIQKELEKESEKLFTLGIAKQKEGA